jgi:hypothetical protein
MPCVFCGTAKLTKEDAWPLWIGKRVPELFVARPDHPDFGKWGTWRGQPNDLRFVSTDPLPTKIRCVCEHCNTGWMSDLEDLSIDILVNMMKGKKRTLYSVSQRIVATWAFKPGSTD